MTNILLARKHSADEVGKGQERGDGNEGLGVRNRSRRLQIGHLTREPLHAAIRQLHEKLGFGPCRGRPQQREHTPIKRVSGIENGHLTSR
jgi:hypothetical protein